MDRKRRVLFAGMMTFLGFWGAGVTNGWACYVCFGNGEGNDGRALRNGILLLLVILVMVLVLLARFFWQVRKRSDKTFNP